MDHLYPDYVKIVATGGNLSSALARDLIEKQPAEVDVEGVELEHLLSDDVNPAAFVWVGHKSLIKLTLAAASVEDINTHILPGTYAASAMTLSQGVKTLAEVDIRLAVMRTNGSTALFDFTHMTLKPKVTAPFQMKERFYLPIEIRSMRGHVFSWSVA